MLTAPSPATYTAEYRPDLQLLVLRWLEPHGLPATQASYRHLLTLAEKYNCARWLLDGRRDGPIDAKAAAWLTDFFFPEAVRALAPARLRLAVFSSPARLEQLRTDVAVASTVERSLSAALPYDTAVFLTEGEALTWLQF